MYSSKLQNGFNKTNLKFFKFPKDEIKSQNWLTSIGLLQNEITKKNKFICQRHFLVENITPSKRLTKNAVPFLNTTRKSNVEEDTPCSSNSTHIVSLKSEMLLTSTPLTQTTSTQTEKDNDEIEFLKLINKINCHNCQTSENQTYISQKHLKKDRIIHLYRKKLQNTSRKFKSLQVRYNNIRRS